MATGRDKLNRGSVAEAARLSFDGATWRAAFAALALLAGCSRRDAAPAPAALRISQWNEPADLDPATASLPDEFFVIRALSEGLVVPVADNPPQPAAAERWDVSADGLRYVFHLRPNEVWSNGEPVTAADFVASFERVLSPATPAPKASLFFGVRNAQAYLARRIPDFSMVGFRATDPHTLVVLLVRPNPHFLDYAASGAWIPVNSRVVQRYGRAWTRPGHYVGNGPFILEEWLPNQRITVRKNPFYRGASDLRLDRIQFVRFDDHGTEERAYRAGEIDVTMAVPYTKMAVYARDRPDELHRQALAETRFLAFNVQRPPLTDRRVRRALSLALDRRRLAVDVLQGGQEPATRLIPPQIAEFPELRELEGGGPDPADRTAAVAFARRLLAEAGYPEGRNFPHLELSSWYATPVLEAIQGMWTSELGIDVGVAVREARVHVAALRAGKYDIGFITLIPDVADPLSVLENFTSGNPDNYPHWSDPDYDGLLADAARSAVPATRSSKLRTAEALLLESIPLAPLYFNSQNWLMRPYVRGWRQDALWNRYYPGLWLDKKTDDAPLR